MSWWRLFTLGFLTVFVCGAAVASEQTFEEGLTAFQNKKFEEARDLFEKAALEHPYEASVLHNLALTELELGHKGRAIALWRKALSVDPEFTAARKGRDYLESRYQMRPWEKDLWSRALNRQLENVAFDQLLAALAVLFLVVGWLWLRYLRSRRYALEEMQPSPAFPTVAVIFSALLIITLSATATKLSFRMASRGTVIVEKVSAKSLPSDQGATLYELTEGNEVKIKRKQADWLQVTNSDGLTGWVLNNQLMITVGW